MLSSAAWTLQSMSTLKLQTRRANVYRQIDLWPDPHKTPQTPDIWQNLNQQEQTRLIAALARLINKAVYRLREPQRGEVIVFHPPTSQSADYIKRIIALPGDTVEIEGGVIYINGSEINESYIKEPPSYTYQQQEILENEYFVLGDNRNNSNDSHNGWVAKREDIIGKAWISMWPPSQWGMVAHYPLQEQLASTKLLLQLP